MIVPAVLCTFIALVATLLITGANGMRSSPGEFEGGVKLAVFWLVAALMWLGWALS